MEKPVFAPFCLWWELLLLPILQIGTWAQKGYKICLRSHTNKWQGRNLNWVSCLQVTTFTRFTHNWGQTWNRACVKLTRELLKGADRDYFKQETKKQTKKTQGMSFKVLRKSSLKEHNVCKGIWDQMRVRCVVVSNSRWTDLLFELFQAN